MSHLISKVATQAVKPTQEAETGWELRRVVEVVEQVARLGNTDLPAALNRVATVAREIAGADEASLFLLDFASDELYVGGHNGNQETSTPVVRVRVGDDTPIATAFQREEELRTFEGDEQIAPGLQTRALITIPLVSGSNRVGLLCVLARRERFKVGTQGRSYLRILASQAALAIERSLRHDETLGFSRALSDIYSMSRSLGKADEAQSLLQKIAESAHAIAKADFVILYEYFQESDDVRLPPLIAGKLIRRDVLQSRSVELDHKKSAIFRMLDREEPFFAEDAGREWLAEGLVHDQAASSATAFFQREQVASSACIPLRVDQECVGLIFLNFRTPVRFSESFQDQLKLFANQSALAIGNARFYLRSSVLNEIGRELGGAITLGVKEIGKLIDKQTQRVLTAPNFFLCLFDDRKGCLELSYVRDQHNVPDDIEAKIEKGLAAYVWRTGEPLLAGRKKQNEIFAAGDATLIGEQAAVWLGAPLSVGEKVLGVIAIQNYEDESAYSDPDLDLFVTVAAQAAIAIDNSRLVEKNHHRRDELQALLELWQAFGSQKRKLPDLLDEMLQQVCYLANCEIGLLFLHLPSREKIEIVAASSGYQEYRGRMLEVGKDLAGLVALSGEPKLENDYHAWDGRVLTFNQTQEGLPHCMVGAPLKWRDEVIGVVVLATRDRGRRFNDHDVHLLERLAGPAAAMIQNASNTALRRALIDVGPKPIVAIETRGRIIEFNAAAEAMLGYKRENLLGTTASNLYWSGRDEALRLDKLLEETGRLQAQETFARSEAGDKIPVALSAESMKGAEQSALGSIGILEDLRLHALRGRTRRLIEALAAFHVEEDLGDLLDLFLVHAVDLLYANSGCILLHENGRFNTSARFDVDNELIELFKWEPAQQRLRDLAAPGKPTCFEISDEEPVTISANARSGLVAPIESEGELLAVLIAESTEEKHFEADLDIVEFLAAQAATSLQRIQRRTEKDTVQSQLLVSANAIAAGQISTSFIHEAKNALNTMALAVDTFSRKIQKEKGLPTKEPYTTRLQGIEGEIERLNELFKRHQRFTRLGLESKKRFHHFNPIIKDMLEILSSVLDSKRLRCEFRPDPELDPPTGGRGHPAEIDKAQVQQVLVNLVLNAINASPERGRLIVGTKNHDQEVELRVTDYGSGMTEEVRSKMFDPFFTSRKEGTGLGLYISRLLVEEKHGGRIEIGKPSKGSSFSVFLPKKKHRSARRSS